MKARLIAPFRSAHGISFPLLLIFCLVNGIILINALIHPHHVGYDTLEGHLPYIAALGTLQLPEPGTSRAFFSPPLPYALPAFVHFLLIPAAVASDIDPLVIAGKVGQLQNVLVSLGLTFFLLKICILLYPDDILFRINVLALLGMMPVYYKSFAFIRGEPFVALLVVVAVYLAGILLWYPDRWGSHHTLGFALSLGLLMLSRQWGILFFPALGIWAEVLHIKWRSLSRSILRVVMMSIAGATLIGGWFYLLLAIRYGTLTAFNRSAAPGFDPTNQPLSFYVGTGLDQLFHAPIYPAFVNQFWPVFYSEIWGDYWTHFVYTQTDPFFIYPYSVSAAYLGQVNLVALIPSAMLIGGLVFGTIQGIRLLWLSPLRYSKYDTSSESLTMDRASLLRRNALFGLLVLVVVISLGGYGWFLVMYPHPERGDTIKATYMLHIFPPLALLAGAFMRSIRLRYPLVFRVLLILLLLAWVYMLPVMITRFLVPIPL